MYFNPFQQMLLQIMVVSYALWIITCSVILLLLSALHYARLI
jgi:hypothetical protein